MSNLSYNNKFIYHGNSFLYNLPGMDKSYNVIRCEYIIGTSPSINDTSLQYRCRQISTNPNIWDVYKVDGDEHTWNSLFAGDTNLLSVIDAYIPDVTKIEDTFAGCTYLKKVNIPNNRIELWGNTFDGAINLTTVNIDTSSGTLFQRMFANTAIKVIPDIDVSNANNVVNMFRNCTEVEDGITAMYNKLSQVSPAHNECFYNCGINTPTGREQLAQIPDDWK